MKQIWRDFLVFTTLLVYLALSGKSPVFIDFFLIFYKTFSDFFKF